MLDLCTERLCSKLKGGSSEISSMYFFCRNVEFLIQWRSQGGGHTGARAPPTAGKYKTEHNKSVDVFHSYVETLFHQSHNRSGIDEFGTITITCVHTDA